MGKMDDATGEPLLVYGKLGLQSFGAAALHVPVVTPCEETLKTIVIKKEGKICHW